MTEPSPEINPAMTILEVVYHYRRTEPVFRKYEEEAGCAFCARRYSTPWPKPRQGMA